MEFRVNGKFDAEKSFDCGQCFRFLPDGEGGIEGVAGNRLFRGKMSGNILRTETPPEDDAFWKNYLDLEADYDFYDRELAKSGDRIIIAASEAAGGIRIFNQELFETLISFIISQNNNIPRIRGIIERLCDNFGDDLPQKGKIFTKAFPTPERLDGIEEGDLAPIRAGFRAKYIVDAVKKYNNHDFDIDFLRNSLYNTCLGNLKQIKGVGDKVASCVLLFAAHRFDAFPVDVWIKRTMEHFYGDVDGSRFGAYPGLAQQYLFYYSRYFEKLGTER